MNNRVQGVRTDPKAYRTVYNVKPVISTVIHLYSALENTRLYPDIKSFIQSFKGRRAGVNSELQSFRQLKAYQKPIESLIELFSLLKIESLCLMSNLFPLQKSEIIYQNYVMTPRRGLARGTRTRRG